MIDQLDHLVLTTADEKACMAFYVGALGMTLETSAEGRKAFPFGNQKINLHIKGREIDGAFVLAFAAKRAIVLPCDYGGCDQK